MRRAVDGKLLRHPDIAFFCDQNPGHEQGDELCCLGRLTLAVVKVHFQANLETVQNSPRKVKSQTPRTRVPSTVG